MLQQDSSLPDVPAHPAPWSLEGQGWIVALSLPPGAPAKQAFLPPELAETVRGIVSLLMYVDDHRAPCGPYRELLFIPGTCRFGDGRRHYTISRIFVSSWDSVVNGRGNWGIPKDRADFEVRYARESAGPDLLRVSSEGRSVCELELQGLRHAPRLPVTASLVPARWRTMAQRLRGCDHYYAPTASGWVRPGRLLRWRFDEPLFPDLSAARVRAVLRVERFRMAFPVARTVPDHPTAARRSGLA